ncbi:hypothetical protein Lfu02_53150 [Longispora fulva]|uniref:DUF5107 domain-containing protein n=1 Tax=Longispora fulva TaxID=619741 RepID=A0A8J7GHJ0_9ACTN|nr:DUF5107 domain-containing protein [Longispora fulva]MBG6140793.1 hypothetical protein [Longispora fulva]GIG60943.1 hypothetical protein Lfu02_53150 [Longispora fulva]
MTELTIADMTLPTAGLGPDSPLPALPGLPGHFPYPTQDGYGRELLPGKLRVAVLENEHVRATIALDLGARLWSLEHEGRELLHRNPVFQPGNLALRDAWFAGGVEWNIGTTGHTPLTCAPMHAARVDTTDGPVLRVWEFERVNGTPYQIDFCLPPGSHRLFVHVRITNPTDGTVPVYWWSNIAVPVDCRVVAPADHSYRYDYTRELTLIEAPVHDGHDYSHPAEATHAADYFFKLDTDEPWIAAVGPDGHGLVQQSTARLTGRKLFVWGDSPGGRHWQDWLGGGYAEIQAGLARTQLDHVPLPPGETFAWVEAYGPVGADVGHGWDAARAAVADTLDFRVLRDRLADWPRWWDAPGARLHEGSGWGVLEGAFPGDLGPDQLPWQTLRATGHLPATASPAVPQHSAYWLDLLERSGDRDWHTWYQIGLITARTDPDGATAALRQSVAATPTAWALRALAHLTSSPDDYLAAVELAPDCWQLRAEAGDALLSADRAAEALALAVPGLHGRLDLLELRAALALGDRTRAAGVFARGLVVPNLREGETSLDELWRETHPQVPLPPEFDFRMTA